MNGVVVPRAERNLVVEVGVAAVFPVVDVVDLTSVKWNIAVRNRTRGVHRFERSPLMDCGQPFRSPDVERDSMSAENHRNDLGVAGEAADGFDRNFLTQRRAAGGGGSIDVEAETVCEGVEIDVDDDFGPRVCLRNVRPIG